MAHCCPECSITLPEKTRDCPECEWAEESDDEDTNDRRAFRGARPSTRGTQRDKSVHREPVYSIMEDRDFSLSSPHTRTVTTKEGATDAEVALLLDRDYSYTPPKPDNLQ
jgi:hypothetical protein